MLDPGSIIALTLLAYQGADHAWHIFQDTLHYASDSEDLILQLELERFRFQTWAKNAGLEEGELSPGLLPVYEIVERTLKVIGQLFENADELRERYGLCASQSEALEPDKVKRFITKMRKSLRASGIKLDVRGESEEINGNEQSYASEVGRPVGRAKRLRWGVRDRKQFQKLITDLESHVEKLNQLLSETQQRSLIEDRKRIDIVFVGNANDNGSLQWIRDALGQEPQTSSIRALVERKALAGGRPVTTRSGPAALSPLTLNDFSIPPGYHGQSRFIAKSIEPSEYVLLEKKSYGSDISVQDKQILTMRVNRLVLLLSAHKSPDFQTLQAIGLIHDPANLCWWIVFKFPITGIPMITPNAVLAQPVSLLALLESKLRPPLETRLCLASKLAITLSELYGSGWLHKNIRSENIVFPALYGGKSNSKREPLSPGINSSLLLSPLVAGFHYSRQETETQTIDKNQFHDDIRPVIYRHPNYQGEAAQGYRIDYDIYSFGLVLSEIAWWVPLSSFLDAKVPIESAPASISSSTQIRSSTTTTLAISNPATAVQLSSSMKRFQRPEALELRRRVISRADRELAFRVGTPYFDVVKWCLEYADQHNDVVDSTICKNAAADTVAAATATEGFTDWHPALEFYNRVVVPLRKIAKIE
ncbi:hypothetical protein, variant 1 [Blastomyces dermatitidis ER-3]|uniref:Prion-inhibition and propagation HeLo domain-containing protein n=1 Tax=Ajellomyces dermatitidis (strain ER-3 / ATCC MYA-2586) TaxID=559297 RepID=A0ABX2VVG0_AJEDR|nr:uncharacterized protein BDCG_04417 [Blastomyces dermatitidis ER-3]XP_045280869.1 hypothetical protein, variant 1 [Blastomyces dermatitidis ER-3]EEQ89297.1 hypothetical protein BDCG_04417 [Blastomyces dermatitidis ER-3]OAT01142.1 hypothetical protein, variant 1 [Blastomyces dermatitidis ER-3]